MGNPLNLRVKDEKKGKLETVAKIMNTSVAELARLCVDIGLLHLERVDYDLAKIIVGAVEQQGTNPPPAGDSSPGADPPSRDPNPPQPSGGRFNLTQIIGPDPAQRAATVLNEDPPAGTLPEVGSQAWKDMKAAAAKFSGQREKKL